MATEPTSITTTSAADKAAEYKQNAIQKAQQEQQEALERNLSLLGDSQSLAWDKLSPKAQIAYLMTKPYNVRTDDGAYTTCKLQFWDAVAFVGRALELGLSILGNDLFPIVKIVNGEARLTGIGTSSEAKARVAARQGCKFGPAIFKETDREWPKRSKITKPAWTEKDLGVECKMTMFLEGVGSQPAEYTAWLSEWYAGNARGTAYWDKNPMWMLRVRAKDKCITLASGVGQSDPQTDDAPEVPAIPYVEPRVTSTTFRPVQQELIPPPLTTPPPRAREQEKG